MGSASYSILIVLDNLESLLTSEGIWRDERWGLLIEALLDHGGFSRTILTSRQLTQDLDSNLLVVEPIFALSLNESILLARDMPNLGRLLMGKSTVSLEKGRDLVSRTLALVHGHPKLIELADAQARNPEALERQLAKAAEAWGDESRLSSFFEEGESSEDAEKFLDVLKGWTRSLSETLPQDARTFFHFLCALEEPDRESWIVEAVWPELWKRLELPGQAPDIGKLLGELKSLVEVRGLGKVFRYSIHPGVAEAGLEGLEEGVRAVSDSAIADFWVFQFNAASEKETEGAGRLVAQAGLRSAPYLMRLERWSEASNLLEEAIVRDKSPGTIDAVLPMLRRIAEATVGTEREMIDAGVLAKGLRFASQWREAEAMMKSLLTKFVDGGKFSEAAGISGYLFLILRDTGRYEEALNLAEEMKGYTSKACLGPQTQLGDEVRRLQALTLLGRYDEVLKAVGEIRGLIETLAEKGAGKENVKPWNVKEAILDTGREAASRSGEYKLALERNAEKVKLAKARGSTYLELARDSFSDYGPLLRLERYEEAEKLLSGAAKKFSRGRKISK